MPGTRWLLALSAVAGGLALVLDAAGAHALSSVLDARRLSILQTAVRLAEVHAALGVAIALFLLSREDGEHSGPPHLGLLTLAGLLLLVGLLLFGGGLVAFALSGERLLSRAAPVGGLAWILAWLLMAASAFLRSGRRA